MGVDPPWKIPEGTRKVVSDDGYINTEGRTGSSGTGILSFETRVIPLNSLPTRPCSRQYFLVTQRLCEVACYQSPGFPTFCLLDRKIVFRVMEGEILTKHTKNGKWGSTEDWDECSALVRSCTDPAEAAMLKKRKSASALGWLCSKKSRRRLSHKVTSETKQYRWVLGDKPTL